MIDDGTGDVLYYSGRSKRCEISGLKAGQWYEVYVHAFDNAGNAKVSNIISVKTLL